MRHFLKQILASFLGLVLFATLGLGGLIFLAATIASTANRPTAIKDDTILAFDLSLNIADATPSRGLTSVLAGDSSGDTVPLRRVLEAIDRAAKDDRIAGLYLYGNVPPGGFATLREVRQALERFRAAGKPIFAYETQGEERDYYLTSVASTLMLNPSGALTINGFRAENMFLTGALQKYGIGVQTLRAGRYKSFVEQYVRTSSSPEAKLETQKLLDDLWGEFLTTTAKSRKLKTGQIQNIANTQGMVLANQALSDRLVDKLAYPDEAEKALRSVTGEKEPKGDEAFRQISLSDYADAAAKDRYSGNRIAVVYAEGDIVSGEGGSGQVGGDRLAEQIRELRQDNGVKAIVLRVDSPGGSASASDIVAREVKITAEQKPVIISMGNYAASGGYLISTYGTQIYASPNTITGSIGVFGVQFNLQKLANANGITWDVTKTAPFADSETITRPKTPQELAIGQRMVNQIYDRFVGTVAESRSIPKAQVNEIAQGRVWSGSEAQKIGLVDHLGGLKDAIQAAAQRANLGDDWQIEEYPKSRDFQQQLFKLIGAQQTATPSDRLSIELQTLRSEIETLKSMNDPQGTYMRLPFSLRID